MRPKDLQIDHFDTSKLFDLGASIRPGNVSEEDELELLEQVRGLDFNKLKQIKELDLAQHEKHLLKKYNIAVRTASPLPSLSILSLIRGNNRTTTTRARIE